MKTASQRRQRTTPSERAQILNDFESSGISERDYAAQHGIGYSTFYGWIRERKNARAGAEHENNGAFVEVGEAMVTTARVGARSPAFVVRCSERVGVEFFPGFTPDDVHAVLSIAQTLELP